MEISELKRVNPWRAISQRPYILPGDEPAMEAFGRKARKAEHQVDLNVFPEPFVGNPDAPIWLLNLNPGLSTIQHSADAELMMRASIRLEGKAFWYLDDRFADTPGGQWWRQKFSSLIAQHGAAKIARSFFCIEMFPYPSIKAGSFPRLPSQQFTFDLVNAGCASQKKFILSGSASNGLSLFLPSKQQRQQWSKTHKIHAFHTIIFRTPPLSKTCNLNDFPQHAIANSILNCYKPI
jgi:hypothetical protein